MFKLIKRWIVKKAVDKARKETVEMLKKGLKVEELPENVNHLIYSPDLNHDGKVDMKDVNVALKRLVDQNENNEIDPEDFLKILLDLALSLLLKVKV